MKNMYTKIILAGLLGLLASPGASVYAAPKATPAPLECSQPIEQLTALVKSKLQAVGDTDLFEEFESISNTIETAFHAFVDQKNKYSAQTLLAPIKKALHDFHEKILKVLAARIENTANEKDKATRKCLLAILTVVHQDFSNVCKELSNYNGSTSLLELRKLGNAIAPYKIRLTKKYRDYSVSQWADAIKHRFKCVEKSPVEADLA